MSSRASGNLPAAVERRLEEIRGAAPRRSPTVRALAAYAQHTDCALATVAFAAGVNLDQLLKGTRLRPPFGQSPFAFQRGRMFEDRLRAGNYAPALALLREALKDPLPAPRIENLRDRHPKTREGMLLRLRDTRALLGLMVKGDPGAPHLIDGAVLRASVGGVEAYYEADALAACTGGQVYAGEIKSFPKVDDRVDADKLGAALDQAAFYILLTREEVDRLGGDGARLVSEVALLITPKNVGMQPTLSLKAVGPRIARAGKLLAGVPAVEDVVASVPAGLSFGPVADPGAEERRRLDALAGLADRIGTAYKPECLASCGNARFCRERAFCSGLPRLLGLGVERVMPGVATLGRAAELSRGAAVNAAEEKPAAELLARAGRLYDAEAPAAEDTMTGRRGA
jgi:hypothetical protein